jgi:putative transposase
LSIRRMVKIMEYVVKEIEPMACKYCQSKRTRRYGSTKADKQRWLCNDCHHTFIESDSLPCMKTPTEQIGIALGMFYEGLSLNAIRRQIEQIHGNMPSDGSVYEWIAKYSKEGVSKAKDYQPNVGNVWLCDETVLKVAGKNVWFYDVIDLKTRFLLSSYLSDRRYLASARIVLSQASKKAGKKPRVVVTDSLHSYPQAIGDVFGCDTKHIQYRGITEEPNNNILERFHGTLKARTKIMRGLKSMESAKLFTDGWLVWYNYLRPHESLADKTPAEYAGVKFPYTSWQDIISDSSFETKPVKWVEKIPPIFKTKEIDINKITGQPSMKQIMRRINQAERRGY